MFTTYLIELIHDPFPLLVKNQTDISHNQTIKKLKSQTMHYEEGNLSSTVGLATRIFTPIPQFSGRKNYNHHVGLLTKIIKKWGVVI